PAGLLDYHQVRATNLCQGGLPEELTATESQRAVGPLDAPRVAVGAEGVVRPMYDGQAHSRSCQALVELHEEGHAVVGEMPVEDDDPGAMARRGDRVT